MGFFKKQKNRLLKSPPLDNPNYRIITIEQPLSLASESYRRVKTSLEFINVDIHPQVIQVCSSVQGEGKTTTVLNIAAAYAEDGKHVLVVDLDFRRPKLHRAFHSLNKNGIADVLVGNIALKDAIIHGEQGIDCLNRGSKVPFPTAMLGSDNMKNVFQELRKLYEYIIVDCPPILAVSDAAIISKVCDGCIFIISQAKTEKNAARESVKVLRDNRINILGCVFTGITERGSNYYSSKYKYYYQNYYGKDTAPDKITNGVNHNGVIEEDGDKPEEVKEE